jgi:signal transduction histidine kinase
MSLRRKLLTAYGALALLALVVAGTGLYALVQWDRTAEELEGHYQRSLALQRVRAQAFGAFREVSDALGGDPAARDQFEAKIGPVGEDFARWSDLADTAEERDQVTQVRAAYDALVADARRVFDLVAQGRSAEALAVAEGQLEAVDLADFEARSDAAVASDRAARAVIRDEVRQTRGTAQLVLALAAFGAVSLSLLIAAYLASDLFAPLREVGAALDAAAHGDHERRLDEARHDEIGAIHLGFNRLLDAVARRERATALALTGPLAGPDGTNDPGANGHGDGDAAAGDDSDWRTSPSRATLHGLVAQLRARVARLADPTADADGDRERDPEQQRELVAEVDRLARAVARLTEFGFPLDLNLARTDIRALLYEVLLRFHDELAARAVSFELDIAPDLTEATVDRLKLRQALGELVRNALDALPEGGGRLGLRASTADDGMVLVLEVADDGVGGAVERHRAPLTGFPDEDGAVAVRPGHLGAGLALARAVVEQHGGQLTVESEPDEGTVVEVTLPLRR